MSVLVMFRVKGDPNNLEEMASDESGGALLQNVREAAMSEGCTRHRFYGNDEEILVVDEWESEGAFRSFFGSHMEIAKAMAELGVTDAPAFEFWRPLKTNDEIG